MSNTAQDSGHDPLVGEIIGERYRIVSLIASGSMGKVYEAIHLPTKRPLAIKTLAPQIDQSHNLTGRFLREAKTASFLNHQHIVEVFDLGRLDDGTLFLVMELARGVTVRALIESGALPARRTLVLARQMLDGIGYAHEQGIVHRDLKPDNIMVVQEGAVGNEYDVVKLVDFGLVKLLGDAAKEFDRGKLTDTGIVLGTPAYMSPEHAQGRPVDSRADLYALGVILFEMLTGRTPFESDDAMTLLRQHVREAPPALASIAPGQPWCTVAMEQLVARALEKEPQRRFASAREMTATLDEAFLSLDDLPA